jgi:hypothetical protein
MTKKNNAGIIVLAGLLIYSLNKKNNTHSIPFYSDYPLNFPSTSTSSVPSFEWVATSATKLAELSEVAGDNAGLFAKLNTLERMNSNSVVSFSPNLKRKVETASDEDYRKATSFEEGGSPIQNRRRVPVSQEESIKNQATIASEGGFTKIREGTYRKITYDNGRKITRVINI